MPLHTGRLLLTPRDPFSAPQVPGLVRRLRDVGLLGAHIRGSEDRFLAGEDFLRLIVFAGCAVRMELEPSAGPDPPACHLVLAGPFPRPRLILGGNTRAPRCRSCRARCADWEVLIAGSQEAALSSLTCGTCGATHPAWDWDWKESAGCGRFFIQVEEVFPGEATPAPELMRVLAEEGDGGWRHFYIQDRE